MNFINYLFFKFFSIFFSIIPFDLLYKISDFIAFILYRIVGYRKKIVFENLHTSFPEKTPLEIKNIAKKFYTNLADVLVESIKGPTVSKRKIIERYKIVNPELTNKYYDLGKSIIVVGGHYCNWEWGTLSSAFQVNHKIIGFYKPLTNKLVDKSVIKSRSKKGVELASIFNTTSAFLNNYKNNCAFIMIADQSPSNTKNAFWVKFLNHDTACLHGPEKYAFKLDIPVFYLDINRVSRGFYELKLEELIVNPTEHEKGYITEKFINRLEENIKSKPENWLWSHKRWKHKKN